MVANHVLLGGVPEGFDAMAIEKEAGKGGVIYIARDASRMQALRSASKANQSTAAASAKSTGSAGGATGARRAG